MAFQINWGIFFRNFPDALMITDSQFMIQFVNKAFAGLVGKDESELVGRLCHQVFQCKYRHTSDCPLTGIQNSGESQATAGEMHCKINNPAQWIITSSPLKDEKGRFIGMLEKVSESNGWMRKTMGAIIQAMSLTIEKRDSYTAGHQRRVAKLCRAIATELGFTWERIQGLRMAAAIHDLGKIHVPAAILNKHGEMSEHEMAIIRMHPQTAYEILKGINFPWPLAEIIYQHHERMDGSGYPRGLKGDPILMEARMLAVADVVESMVSFRPYRPALGIDDAIDEIRRNRGVLYDSEVVDACMGLFTEKGFDFKTKNWQDQKADQG